MKKSVLIISCISLISICGKSQPESMWQLLQNGTIIRWAYIDGDEFNGNELNTIMWADSYPWGRNLYNNKELQWYSPNNNYDFSGNKIKLIVKEETVNERVTTWYDDNYLLEDGLPNKRQFDYTSGMVMSKRKYKYGLFEISFRIPEGKGLWPAFWLYGPENAEIDVFEFKGENPNIIKTNHHWTESGQHNQNPKSWTATGSFADGFNNMMLEWGPGAMIWYLNGQEFNLEFHDYPHAMWVIANIAVAGCCDANAPFCPCPDETTNFPAAFEIEYIRIWKRLDCEEYLTIENYEQDDSTPTSFTGQKVEMLNSTLHEEESLTLIATEEITLLPGATIKGNFTAKIIECPGPSKSTISNSFSNFGNLSIEKPDTINSTKTTSISSETSIENNNILMTIYPNPSNDYIKVNIPTFNNINSILIEIIDSNGKLIYKNSKIKDTYLHIDISEQPKGMYFFRAIIDNKVYVEKFIVQ
jgi:beta-glucanase (GH16 family)